jgi:hypothetical protein
MMSHLRSTVIGFAAGLTTALATTAIAQVKATVNTNGVLVGYTVQKDGKTICRNPSVYN